MEKYIDGVISDKEELEMACNAFRSMADSFNLYQEPMAMLVAFHLFIKDMDIKVLVDPMTFHKIVSDKLYYDWPDMARPN